jgi:hypothetical protein
MTEEDKKKDETEETTEMPATEAEQAQGQDPVADSDGNAEPRAETGADSEAGSGLSGKLKIAAASAAAVVVAFLLFIAPGDRVLGFESDGHGMERSHDDRGDWDDDGPDMDERGDYDGYEGYGPGGMPEQGGYGGPAAPPQGTPPPPMPPQAAPQGGPQAAPQAAPQGGSNSR